MEGSIATHQCPTPSGVDRVSEQRFQGIHDLLGEGSSKAEGSQFLDELSD